MDENEWKQVYPNTRWPIRPESENTGQGKQGMTYDQSLHKPPDTSQSKEAGAKYGAMLYDRSRDLLPEGEYEAVPSAKIQTSNGMVYDASFPDPLDPSEYKVVLDKPTSEQIYTSTPENPDVMTFSGLGNFLEDKCSKGMEKGNYDKTINHFEKVITEGDLFLNSDVELQGEIKNLIAEARALKTQDDLKQFWPKVQDFLTSLEIEKTKKGG
jgi:hypothetical protein